MANKISEAKTKAKENLDYNNAESEAKEYAGSEWSKLTKSEKEDLIQDMLHESKKNIDRMEEGGEADSEREDEEREEANEKLEELMEEYDLPREVIEEYASNMGIEIDDIDELPYNGRYDSEEDFAEDLVEQGAVSNLSYYLEMTSLDMRLLAQEEADNRVDNMDDDEILDAMDMQDEANEYNELKDEIYELESDVDDLKNKLDDYLDEEDLTEGEIEMREEKAIELKEEIDEKENELEDLQHKLASMDTYDEVVDKAREQLIDVYYDDIHDELERDAVGYFVDTLGYAEEDLAKNSLFRVDLEKLASDLSHDYTFIEHGGDVYVFASYMGGGMTYAKGGRIQNQYEDRTPKNVWDYGWNKEQKRHFLHDHSKKIEKSLGRSAEFFYADYKFDDLMPQIQRVIEAHVNEGQYADGGSIYAKGGNLPSIEKRVAEVNAMIKEGNEKGLKVVDESQTWQSPMKYKPLKYSNGVLYGEYEELNLYKSNRGQGNAWETKKFKITKRDEDYGYSDNMDGYAQRLELTDIARMYRKALNHFNKYGWYGDGGKMAKGGKLAVRNEDIDEDSEINGKRRYGVEIQDESSGDVLDYEYFNSEKEAKEFISKYKSGYMADGGYMAKGGMTEHGLKNGDKIISGKIIGTTIIVHNDNANERARIDLNTGERTVLTYNQKTNKWEEKMADGGTLGAGSFAKGGATFDDKVKSIKKRLEGMSVAPKYRKEYGKTYDKSEALSAAKAIAGSMRAKEMSKKKS